MDELIERIENAEAGSRELDALIAAAVGVEHGQKAGFCNSENGDYYVVDECAPHFTTSLDAAMTLVPEGWTTFQYTQGPSGKPHRWDLCRIRDGERSYTHASAQASTPALALCAAALRAQTSEDNHGQ